VSLAVVYDVGSRDEERGKSGLGRLLEQMMFGGSRNVAGGDHVRLAEARGGAADGAVDADRTAFFETLPAGELALGLWLEADRMGALDLSRESFEDAQSPVERARRRRVAGTAHEPGAMRLEELVYQGFWPYDHDGAGAPADLAAATLDSVQAFHAAHYGPSAAVLAIAGDVGAEEAIGLARRYFEPIPRREAAPHPDAALPEQTSQRTSIVKDPQARTPGVLYGWAVPPARSADHEALTLAGAILGEGESSRLHQLLVRDRGLAQRVSAGTAARRGPDLFSIDAVLADGARAGDVERIVEAEIKALATRGPTDAEMERARRLVEASLVLGLESNVARARRLGEYELSFGDAGLLAGELPRYFAITRDDVKRAVAQHLGPTRRTLIETVPPEGGDAGAKPAAKATAAPKRAAPATRKAAGKARRKKP
jgi:zinc protease